MSTPRDVLIRAFERMRNGSIVVLIGWIFLGIVSAALIVMAGRIYEILSYLKEVYEKTSKLPQDILISSIEELRGIVSGLLICFVITIISSIIILVGIRNLFLPGIKRLTRFKPEFSMSEKLIRIGLFYGMIVLIILEVFNLVVASPETVSYILLSASIRDFFMIIGFIGLATLFLKLNSLDKESLYLAAGILFIIVVLMFALDSINNILVFAKIKQYSSMGVEYTYLLIIIALIMQTIALSRTLDKIELGLISLPLPQETKFGI